MPTLNVDFLRSGAEFKPSPTFERRTMGTSDTAAPSPRSSRNARLAEFHAKTLNAFKTSDLDAWDGLATTAPAPTITAASNTSGQHGAGPAVLNVDFLRSGAEFKPR